MVYRFEKVFDKNTIQELNDIIKNYEVVHDIGLNRNEDGSIYYNQYKKQLIELPENIKQKFTEVIENFIETGGLEICYTRVNLVEENTNVNDDYHTDKGYDLIFTYYPNDDYEGGEFEWVEDGKVNQIKPIKDTITIMIDNPPHRVCNVIKGERYSIVTFCKTKRKKQVKFI